MREEPTFRSAGAKEGFGLAATCRLRADQCHGEALQKLSEEDGALGVGEKDCQGPASICTCLRGDGTLRTYRCAASGIL